MKLKQFLIFLETIQDSRQNNPALDSKSQFYFSPNRLYSFHPKFLISPHFHAVTSNTYLSLLLSIELNCCILGTYIFNCKITKLTFIFCVPFFLNRLLHPKNHLYLVPKRHIELVTLLLYMSEPETRPRERPSPLTKRRPLSRPHYVLSPTQASVEL